MKHELRFTRGEIAALLWAVFVHESRTLELEAAIRKLEQEAELLG